MGQVPAGNKGNKGALRTRDTPAKVKERRLKGPGKDLGMCHKGTQPKWSETTSAV